MLCSFDIDTYISRLEAYGDGGIKYERGCPLSSLTTFKIGGECTVAVFPCDKDQLLHAVLSTKETGARVKVIGRGSNLLCSDAGYDGIVIVSEGAKAISLDGDCLECESGASLTATAQAAAEASLESAEFMYGIPGTVGGGVFMNAGAYGGQMSDVVESVCYVDINTLECFTVSGEALDFSYRHSLFSAHPEYAVLSVRIKLKAGSKDEIQSKMRDFITRRREKQPLEYPSAGSTFKRCEGHYTSQLIDEAGLKGLRVGGAEVSEKHAGFVINRGGATARDVLALIEKVKAKIKEKYNLDIECEVEYLE